MNGDIAIIGMAGRFPGAGDVTAFWHNLRDGVESISELSEEDILAEGIDPELARHEDYVRKAPVLDGIEEFDARFFGFTAREAALLDPQQRLFLECAWHAVEDAGIDPGAAGRTGVFAGANLPAYLMSNLLGGRRIVLDSTMFELQIHNDKDYLASRTAHRLGLTGPAVSVQTACSTSLVAVHQAAESLLSGTCEVALAGGVCVRVPHRVGYRHERGLIYAPDGRCRPFDAEASGTVFGNGVGVVVLKRLPAALDDGDRVLAVLKGSAVNNDGADKVGYTAPSEAGQREVVTAALRAAGVPARSVTAVEAHGTGTFIGDPIEVAALAGAFGQHTGDRGFCALGSVKSNIGHLESAAGVASLIKAVLQLRHRQLVPSLHFRTPNPRIDFPATPFYVNAELADWPGGQEPRRIGVSSFGIGGTNAHVVLEEAPAPPPSTPEPGPQLVVLSAKTPQALDALTTAVSDHLAEPGAPELADVAGTLQTGRQAMRYRRVVLAADSAEAATRLTSPGGAHSGDAGRGRTGVVFLFPGQGAQYAGMGRGLYEDEPVFAGCVDRCAEILLDEFGFDLRSHLYTAGCATGKAAEDELLSTDIVQPALFVTEYALAELLTARGVTATAMVGHSVGEFVAACLAGVLSLPDALRLITRRGRLIRRQPSGSMLSVAAPENEVAALLPPGTAIAAVNAGELCVASGPEPSITELERTLVTREVPVRRLHTSHAFHSPMMDPVVPQFTEAVRQVALGRPRRPFVSGVTGDWITPEQAADPGYWGVHLRRTVRFADAVRTAADAGPCVFVEVGPGNTLSTLARSAAAGTTVATVSTMRRHDQDAGDRTTLLTALGDLWLAGGAVDWRTLHEGPRRRLPLPAYPFQRDRYWVEPSGATVLSEPTTSVLSEPAEADEELPADRAPRPGSLLTGYAAPSDETQRGIVTVWEEFFGIAPIGVHDNFFELGGHSLLATQILNRLRKSLGAAVPLNRLLSTPTVAGLAEAVRDGQAGEGGPGEITTIVPDPARAAEPFPLTEMQQAQWIGRLDSFDMGGVAPHLYHEFDSDTLDVPRLERAWQQVVRRHDMLRMMVLSDGRQRTLTDVPPYRFAVLDLRDEPPEVARRELDELRERMSAEVRRADTWPLWEIRISLLGATRVRVHISFDLLVADVACFFYQILPQWRDCYEEPENRPRPLTLSFRDYVLAEAALRETPMYERSLQYWRKRVRELPASPELPTVVAMSELDRPRFVRRHARLDAEVWGRIKAQAGERGLTPSAALLTAFAAAIATWSKNQRFTLNFTAVNRLPFHEQVDELVGEFASFDLLEVDAAGPATFAELAGQLQRQSWEDFEHRYVSGVRILRERARARGSGTSDVMPVVFTSALPGDLDGKPAPSPVDWLGEQAYFISQTPQVTIDHFLLEFEGHLELAWHAVDELFPDGLMAELFDAYREFVAGLAEPAGWDRRPLLDLPRWQLDVRARANATAGPLPGGLLCSRVLDRAASDAPAVITAERTLSFRELAGRAVALARALADDGLGRGSLVGVGLPKGWPQIVAVLAASAAGCTYVPIDPALPESRRAWLAEHAGVECVLTDAAHARWWPDGLRTVLVDETGDWTGAAVPDWACPARPEDLAYVIYTSGSTGTPKGVAVNHRAALNTLVDVTERFGIGARDRVLGLSSLSFDLSVFDVFGVLGAGAALVLPEAEAGRDPGRWLDLVTEHRVTVWNSVPALMQMLVEHAEPQPGAPLGGLRLAMLSGDWIPVRLPDRLRACAGEIDVVSLGGATEAAVWSIAYPVAEVGADWTSVPYGYPLRNQTFHVLNDRLAPAPVWVPGELYIGGAGLAECYWHDEPRTAESFVVHPDTGERLYRTGDLGRYLPDGAIEFLGRDDFQVKIGGFRVELGEIEHALTRHPAVVNAVASALGPRTQQRLVAHVVSAEEDPAALRAHLGALLPSYMIPADFVFVDEMPLSANGKVDRAALPEPHRSGHGGGDTGESSEVVRRITGLAGELLGVDNAGPDDNFFELGGDSIMGVQLVTMAAAEGLAIRPQDLFEARTFAELGRTVGTGDGTAALAGGVPLSPHQAELVASSSLLVLDVPADFDPALAERVLGALHDRHTALRARVPDGDTQYAAGERAASDSYVPEIDLSTLPERVKRDAVARMGAEMAGELDLAAGPVTKLAVVRLGADTAKLLWAVSGCLVDDGSFAVLARDFRLAHGQLAAGGPIRWGSAAGCGLAWHDRLERTLAGTAADPGELVALEHTRHSTVDAAAVGAVFGAAAAAYHLSPAETVLAALTVALTGLPGEPPQLRYERSARSIPGTSAENASNAVGRFTEALTLDAGTGRDLRAALRVVKQQARADATAPATGPVVVLREFVDWGGEPLLPPGFAGVDAPAGQPGGTVVEVTAGLVRGELRTRWRCRSEHDDWTAALVAAFGRALDNIGEHCGQTESGDYEPSDFPLAGLSSDELAELLSGA